MQEVQLEELAAAGVDLPGVRWQQPHEVCIMSHPLQQAPGSSSHHHLLFYRLACKVQQSTGVTLLVCQDDGLRHCLGALAFVSSLHLLAFVVVLMCVRGLSDHNNSHICIACA